MASLPADMAAQRQHDLADPQQRPSEAAAERALRQSRHLSKNALQRIIAQIEASGLRTTQAGAMLADAVQRRIMLSARISDALFGFTAAPGPLDQRLRWLTEATIGLFAADTQILTSSFDLVGRCPDALTATVMQIAHEMLGNAVLHGLRHRERGRIHVSLLNRAAGGTILEVCDDGGGPGTAGHGEGLSIMAELARSVGGAVTLSRRQEWTVARLSIPVRRKEAVLFLKKRTKKLLSAGLSWPGR